MFAGLIPHPVAAVFLMASVLVRLLFLVLQLWIVFQGIRRYGLEGWMVMPAVVLWGIGSFQTEFLILHIPERWSLFGFSIRLNQISDLLLVLVVALLLLRRLLKSLQLQRQMALDVKQAQEVQQVILPESVIAASGLSIESEYRPAREVGGDFFQVIPNPTDDSVLIVAGDVTGKGLKAGMLVALLIGAIRTTAEERSDPAEILAVLNRRLLGRGDSYATCLAMRIERDGSVTLTNAGHLPPYLNGTPLEIEGSLPLGMVETLDLTVLNFDLAENDWLLMVSDGVAEATNHAGELFSFDRLQELLRTHPSATEIADAAQAFGQDDDISVLSVRKVPVAEPAMA
jgi:serine phosphatase RsbU (regulator of sigma subunit)